MRLPADYHVHTPFSDGEDGVEACVERAARLGLPELGFAEHLAPTALADWSHIDPARLGVYVETVRTAAGRHPDLRVLCGVEADVAPGAEDELRELLRPHAFDYVVCSAHVVDGFSIDEERFLSEDGWRDVDRVWRRSYETIRDAVATGLYTVVGHLDLPKKWGRRPSQDLSALEDEVLGAVARAGAALEVNTSGLCRHPVAEVYPAPALLARSRRLGIPIVYGSDAHHAADIAAGFEDAVATAAGAGYDTWKRLSDGTPQPQPASPSLSTMAASSAGS